MRTVADVTITQALIDTQSDANKIPYIHIYIDDTDYSSRLLYLEHHEEPYRERAVIGLSNRDGALDDLDLTGCEFEIGYGYDSTSHGGSANDYVLTATLWVKSIQKTSKGGERIYQIYAEGMWSRLRMEKTLPGVVSWKATIPAVEGQYITPSEPNGHYYECTVAGVTGETEPSEWPLSGTVDDGTVTWSEAGSSAPYSNLFNATHTIEEIMQLTVESLGWTWTPVSDSDGLIDVFHPVFAIGQGGYEAGASVLYRLVWMTKSYLRCRPSTVMQPVYRTEDDVADIVYYSDQDPYFDEFDSQIGQLEPNSILILCNQDPSGEWNTPEYKIIPGTAVDQDEIDKYFEVIEVFTDGNIRTPEDADARADAILTRIKAESSGGRVLLPFHDCQIELYDKVGITDNRI